MGGYLGYRVAVVRLRNTRGYVPKDAARLRSTLRGIAGAPVTVHVSPDWVELVVFNAPPLEELVGRLAESGYSVAEAYLAQADHGPAGEGSEALAERYVELLSGGRFWEAHEVAENIWHTCGPEGKLLAAIAGAHAKAQEGAWEPARAILERARREAEELGVEQLVDWRCLGETLARVHAGLRGDPAPCLERLVRRIARGPPRRDGGAG
jgi:hypothetical protein